METIRKPGIARAVHGQEVTTREEPTAKLALETPDMSFSWSDFLAVVEVKVGLKSCHYPPETYGIQLTKKIPSTADIHGSLRTTSVAKISDLPEAPNPRAIPLTPPLDLVECAKRRKPGNDLSSWRRKSLRSIIESL